MVCVSVDLDDAEGQDEDGNTITYVSGTYGPAHLFIFSGSGFKCPFCVDARYLEIRTFRREQSRGKHPSFLNTKYAKDKWMLRKQHRLMTPAVKTSVCLLTNGLGR